jgi:mitochondrial import receptor subunit TOM70
LTYLILKFQKDYEKAKDECDRAIELDPVYVKALIRRSKVNENIGNLEGSLEDVTSACILEGFSSESTLLSADRILKALGMTV